MVAKMGLQIDVRGIEIMCSLFQTYCFNCLHLLGFYAKSKEDLLQRLRLVPLHEEAGRLLGEQAAVPHDPHHVGVPRLLDVVGGDDDADT